MHTELFSHTLLVNCVIGDTVEFYCPEYGFCRLHDAQRKLQYLLSENNILTYCYFIIAQKTETPLAKSVIEM